MDKIMILWELTLTCNLNCIFCISWERRKKSKSKITFDDAIKIIDNLPDNSHISFVWWELFTFWKPIEILKYMDQKWITYEITTNGSLLGNYIDGINALKNLTKIHLSLDLYGEEHDKKRGYHWLFNKIINIIPKIKTIINVNTVIFPETKDENIIKLHSLLETLKIDTHRISYYMNFSSEDINNSLKKIEALKISTRFSEKIENKELLSKTIKIYKSLLYIKKTKAQTLKLDIHPISILKGWPRRCRSMSHYYRINEYWNLSTCHFIDNEFDSLIYNKFMNIIKNKNYMDLKRKIIENYPLDICLTCWKWE